MGIIRLVPKALRKPAYFLLARAQKRRAWKEAAEAFRGPEPPLLIYQMGKVGSSAVYRALCEAGIPRALQIHFLSGDLAEHRRAQIAAGRQRLPYHLDLGDAVRARLTGPSPRRCRVITLVREPISFTLSNVCENPDVAGLPRAVDNRLDPESALPWFERLLTDPHVFLYPFRWFDRELKPVFGIDLFAEPFSQDAGWQIYRGERADALLLRTEDLSRVGPEAISSFLGLPEPLPLTKVHARSETGDAAAYQAIRAGLRLPRELCERIYAERFVRHFYCPEMIARFTRTWTGEDAAVVPRG